MKKKLNKIIIIGLAIVMVTFIFYKKITDNNPYNDFKNISINESLNQKDKSYYLYYYMKDCYYCNLIKEDMFNFAKKHKNIYFVDIDKYKNQRIKYDWESFNTKNDKEIGYSKDGKSITYYEGESEDKYLHTKEKNKYGKTKMYEIVIADKEYKNENKNAKLGKVYAKEIIPEIDYSKYKYGDKLIIAGSPTLLYVTNGKIDDFYFDSRDIGEYVRGEK